MRQAPKLWGCSKATVERDIAKGFEIRPLRHPRTAECFARNVLGLVMMRDARPAPTAGYVVTARRGHDRTVTRSRKPRKLAKRAGQRATTRKGAR